MNDDARASAAEGSPPAGAGPRCAPAGGSSAAGAGPRRSAAAGSTATAAPRRAAICTAAIVAASLAAVTGCSATPQATAGPAATATATATVSAPATAAATVPATTAAPSTTSPTPVVQTSNAPPPASPALGQLSGVFAHGAGFGQVKPTRIFNGGDPTGLVTRVVWKSWGGARALATGESDYVAPTQSVATGTEEPVTVVAFDLGSCDGKLMYRAVEWYADHRQGGKRA